MYHKRCMKAECEYLCKTLLHPKWKGGTWWCRDVNTFLQWIDDCGIVDEDEAKRGKNETNT